MIKKTGLVWLFLAAGLLLRLNNLSQRSLWTDEFFTLFESSGHGTEVKMLLDNLSFKQPPRLVQAKEFKALLRFSPHKGIKDVSLGLLNTDTHPPLYFWLMHYWMRIFGDSVSGLRFFSVLLGVLSIFLAYRITLYLFNPQAAVFSALFVTISPLCVRYSQEARAYSLVMALGLLSWFFILRLEKQRKNLDAFCFAIFNCLGFYTHYFYIFIAFAQFAYFTLFHHRDSALLNRFYLFFMYSMLFFSFWFIPVILQGYNFYLVEWIFGYPGLINKLYYLCFGFTRYILIWDESRIPLRLASYAGLFLFVYAAKRAAKDIVMKSPKAFWFCLIMFLLPLLGMFCIDILQRGALLKQERFWVFSFIGLIPLAGRILDYGYLKERWVLYLLILLMFCSALLVTKTQFGPAPEYVSHWINQEAGGAPAAVVAYHMRSVVFSQSYYLDDDIYLIPVSDRKRLQEAVNMASEHVQRMFLVRHYHRTDAYLMDADFMGTGEMDAGFKFKASAKKDDISVSEYIKCAL